MLLGGLGASGVVGWKSIYNPLATHVVRRMLAKSHVGGLIGKWDDCALLLDYSFPCCSDAPKSHAHGGVSRRGPADSHMVELPLFSRSRIARASAGKSRRPRRGLLRDTRRIRGV